MPADRYSDQYEKAFRAIFDTYKNRLFGYVLAISHSHYAAEEITQEIFLKLWVCRDMLDSIDNLEHYIFTIARNKTLNHLRKAATDSRILGELREKMLRQTNNVEERSKLAECERLITEAIDLLSPRRRLVYQLSRHQGLNHDQIASQLQLSNNTVKNHLVEALAFIRSYLERHGAISMLISWFLF